MNKSLFKKGLRDGIPIGLGYFAVAFSLGIAARSAGITAFQGFMASILTEASAGEYAGFSLIATKGAFIEMAVISFVINIRYILMSTALSQRLDERTTFIQRLLLGATVTDEIFGITIAQEGPILPYYSYGAYTMAAPMWALGTSCGIIMGTVLPAKIVSALSVALFGMFLAVIIPESKKNRIVLGLVLISFILSYISIYLLPNLSEGFRVTILTVVLSLLAAYFFPVKRGDK